jgi:hypothetical protein
MNENNNEYLLKSLDNENNSSIGNLNSRIIKTMKNDYLQQLQLSRENIKELHLKLKEYRYVDDLTDIQYGRYIRWINLKDPLKIYLTNGGIVIDIKIHQNGIQLVCKNFINKKFQIKIDECFIFQKLTDQEKTILCALDYLDKNS